MRVITYQSPGGWTVDVTPQQEKAMVADGFWPRDPSGAEACQVSMGLHRGFPTFTIDELREKWG